MTNFEKYVKETEYEEGRKYLGIEKDEIKVKEEKKPEKKESKIRIVLDVIGLFLMAAAVVVLIWLLLAFL